MSSTYTCSLMIFRRDLRLDDNTALRAAAKVSDKVVTVFCCDPRQLKDNDYAGNACVQFLSNSLQELKDSLDSKNGTLVFFEGDPLDAIRAAQKEYGVEAVFHNADYTPFSKDRDEQLYQLCQELGLGYHASHDALLNAPGTVFKDNGDPYVVFTPFKRKAAEHEVAEPVSFDGRWCTLESKVTSSFTDDLPESLRNYSHPLPLLQGGRAEALTLLDKIDQRGDYDTERDIPSVDGTTHLAPHHKFGTISVRETYHRIAETFGVEHTLITELYWRDFFTHIAAHFPRVFGESFRKEYDRIRWSTHSKNLVAWKEGKTGFPIVDAGMRELVQTGYMHNRVRMIVASFLVKDLLIDWREGEKFFAQHLMDYDPSVNNGNWQWAASTGCDAQPYFRIFNPWSQQKKHDPECTYVKKWVPELADLSAKEIHALLDKRPQNLDYPEPIVDHKEARERTLMKFKEAKG